ncbi:MAG: ABC transporter ATP-binding protein [Candidatus Cloacimonetes bacterium]|nr:ABC transporter ATP-binding protein [Candidatus Cloacimonadota bacterium]
MALIEVSSMVKQFPMGTGMFTALKNINLVFSKGEFTGIVGPSGSGKTTLLNILGSLDTQTEGEVKVMDNEVSKLSHKAAAQLRSKQIGFIFQTFNLLPHYTVFENVEFPLLLLNIAPDKRRKMVLESLEWVDLTDKIKSKPRQLSGGECQRVAIARAMVKRPSIVLADEPTANLDADNSYHVLRTMKKLNEELSTTFIFSTHDYKVIEYLNRKITLRDGQIASDENLV